MLPPGQYWSSLCLHSRSDPQGISTNIVLPKGGLLGYNEDYGKEETEDYEIADHDKGLENKMDEKEKTDEERLSDHKNFLGQWEMVKQFGVGLQG